MSDSHLPSDLSQWPEDPYDLLGIDRSADHVTMRRAYVRLIRFYRPEHYPDQFRIIREAYEYLDCYLRYREQFPEDAEDAEEAETIDSETDQDAYDTIKSESTSDIPSASPKKYRTSSAAETAWAAALQGNSAEAYRTLQELERQHPGDEYLCLRLYWLLLMQPGLDPSRDRRTWLVAGIPSAEYDGPLMQLYHRELEGDPNETIHSRCRSLMMKPGLLAPRAYFVMQCWRRLGLSGNWNQIAQDLVIFRDQTAHADANTWVRMLLACKEQFQWQTDRKAHGPMAHACQREIDEYAEEHQRLAWELDRGDYADALIDNLRQFKQTTCMPSEEIDLLADIIRRGWALPFSMIRDDLMKFLKPMVESPFSSLELLDRVHRISPFVLDQLNYQTNVLYHDRLERQDENGVNENHRKAVSAFFDVKNPLIYEYWRKRILIFCLRRKMTFSQFQNAAGDENISTQLVEHWKNDLPLHCITTACRAFWAVA